MPRVIPITAGPITDPAIAVATCEILTSQKFCEKRMMADAMAVNMAEITTYLRLCGVASIKAPAGAASQPKKANHS